MAFIGLAIKGIADAFNNSARSGLNMMQYQQYGRTSFEQVQKGIRANENAQAGISQFSNLTSNAQSTALNNTAGIYGSGTSELRNQLVESIAAARGERTAALNTNATRINSAVSQDINNASSLNAETQNQYTNGMTIAQSLGGVLGSIGMLIFAATKGGKPADLPSGTNSITPQLSNVSVNMNTGYSGGSRANVTSVGATNTINSEVDRANRGLNEAFNTALNTQVYGQSGETFSAHGEGTVLNSPPRYSSLQVQNYLSEHGRSMQTQVGDWISEHGNNFSHYTESIEPVASTSTGGMTHPTKPSMGPTPFTDKEREAVLNSHNFFDTPQQNQETSPVLTVDDRSGTTPTEAQTESEEPQPSTSQ
ncbi:MAG: hypothetical protein GuPV1_gp2 [Guiyang polycipivirus 1]|nr:MAG: hypothetical protein GuPV1_gp2 [Guiyang polycipivirus 1]